MTEELKVVITAEVDKLRQEINKGKKEVESFSKEGTSALQKFGDAAKKVGDAVKTGLKVASVAITAAAAGVAALTKASIDSYAEYEQLVGGVETLFGKSADVVQKYAANAYKTAGLSANEYMETVTSFSASLLQSLGGDTAEAAKYGDMAITDMADNANKMGTSMEMIQNAYQGFAKQNYTMLDNLKLGYGGTKEEMERLLKDATKLTGVKYDINNLSDVYSAIHAIQGELGITGTTAKEAASTISGSVAMTKSAWSNLLTGIADENADFEGMIDDFISSVEAAANNLLPRIEIAINGISQLIAELVPVIAERIPSLIETTLPQLLTAGVNVVTALVEGIVQAAPSIITAVLGMIPQVIDALVEGISLIVEALPTLIETLMASLPEILPQLIDGIVSLIVILCENFSAIIQPIIDNLPMIIMAIVMALVANLPTLIQGVIDLVVGIVNATGQIIEVLVPMIPEISLAIVKAIWDSLPTILGGVWDVIKAVLDAIGSLVEGIKGYLKNAWEAIKEVLGTIGGWINKNVIQPVANFFKGMWDGLKNGAKDAWNGVKNVFSNVTGWFKDQFTKAWAAVKNVFSTGGKIFDGIKDGITSAFKTIVNAIIDGINKVIAVPFKAINKTLSTLKGVDILGVKPFGWVKTFTIPEIPKLAKGGVVDGATLATIGEQGKEMIMPLENNLEYLDKLASLITERMGGGNRPIVLTVDGKVFAQTSINTINDLTRQTGSLKLNIV